ncbi:hypothetical protein ACIQI8_27165 [Streptomyces sp. NPDC092369]|uniref:hypothetical protein n=1 Tax=Streptomyces sp. NPDC092369 TaxID=3366015 RepID=UPI003805E847
MYPDYDTPRLTGPYLELHAEREEQKGRLGAEHHTLDEWALALCEHAGAVATAVLAAGQDPDNPAACRASLRQELLATGAGLIAFLEHVDSLEESVVDAT